MVYDLLSEFRILKTTCTSTLKTRVTKFRCRISRREREREKMKEYLSPKHFKCAVLLFTRLCLFFFGEAKKTRSKTLITPCAPGEFDFSAPSRKEELWALWRLKTLLWVKKVLVSRPPQTPCTVRCTWIFPRTKNNKFNVAWSLGSFSK